MIDARKRNIAVMVGVAAWFCAAMVVHFAPVMFDGGVRSGIMFALALPLGWVTMRLVEALTRPTPTELVALLSWGTLTALVLDGVAITFVNGLYAGVSRATQYGASWIMWGAGVGMAMPFFRRSV